MWRAVAVPSEHGGWGLTAEPIALGLLVGFSVAGLAIGTAAMLAFLVRTPLKLAVIDHRRGRRLERTVLARRLAIAELAAIALCAAVACALAGPAWLVPIAIAAPPIALELWFDVRSRGRRLVPELAGSVGIASVAAAIVIAADGTTSLAVAVWVIIAARAIVAIPFVRTQIQRLRHGAAPLAATVAFQVIGIAVAISAAVVDQRLLAGATAVAAGSLLQCRALGIDRIPPAKVLGVLQMVFGLVVVGASALGVLVA
jgi:hypothetical protein